jgi:peptide/nickel transport system permease protein
VTGFILRRLAIAIPILFAVSIVTFTFANLAPGDPVSAMIRPGSDVRPSDLAALKEALGLNKPFHERYLAWLGQVIQGNFGATISGTSVASLLGQRIPNTIKLIGLAAIIGVSTGVFLGVISAFRQGTWLDNLMTVVVFLGVSLPSYLLAVMGTLVFVIGFREVTGFGLFPSGGSADPNSDLPRWLDELWHLALPVLTLSFGLTATFLRYTRASILEVLRQDHVTTARAKGLRELLVRRRHILRNGLLPIVTVMGVVLPLLITGALFIETLFRWPGVGQLMWNATQTREYNIIMAVALLVAVAIVLSNLIVDILYAFIDPRIRYQ